MIYLDARKQFDGPVHNLLLRGVRTQLLRGLLGHIAKANQQGIQSFGDLAVLQGKLKESASREAQGKHVPCQVATRNKGTMEYYGMLTFSREALYDTMIDL